ncbi:potassium transporter TrkG [Tabrizicola oligotrophica]|uniref:potassium transporter TrkG n=1 Tax=Tabrizicola oligotrophica TaxID=2710650 RepID=UPI001D1268D7|nr:potassium transporter TrkG [Tabrizicola oligotrophica]
MLRRLLQLPLLVLLLGLAGLAMFLPAGHAFVMRDHALARAFVYMALLVLVAAGMLGLARANAVPRNVARNHLVSLALAYAILPPVLALPLIQRSAGGAEFGAATFEMLSAFTTTGAPVLEGPLKPSVQLWRALVGWLGGLFALVMVFSVLMPLNLGGVEVETGRIPGRASPATQQITRVADPSERMARFAAQIFPVYTGLTLSLWIVMFAAGEDGFVALCHAMAVLSTSGISPVEGGTAMADGGWLAELAMAAFLIFALSRRPLLRLMGQRSAGSLRRDPELGLAAVLVALATLGLFLVALAGAIGQAASLGLQDGLAALWALFFTCLSFLTTTGFVGSGWQEMVNWSGMASPDVVLWGLAIVGGGVAGTAGGVKLLRVHALLRYGEQELDRVIHPNAVGRSRGGAGISRAAGLQGAAMAWVFFMIFGLSIAVFAAVLTILGLGFDEALVLVLSALTTTGPLAAQSGGIAAGFAGQEGPVQAVLGLAMVVGRLETLAVLAILLPENLRG